MPKALATFATYASYPALDCLSQNFVQCGQAIKQNKTLIILPLILAIDFLSGANSLKL